jgi:radical SAM protein with 4Fe4S-binding SPASM domain
MNTTYSMPQAIEIEINSHCNLACSYCPNSIDERIEKGNMDLDLYRTLLNQLKEKNYSGKIAFDFYNEPTLAKEFDQYIKLAKQTVPLCFLSLYTNGTQIKTLERSKELIDIGFGEVIITKHEAITELAIEQFYDHMPKEYQSKYILRGFNDLTLTNRGGTLENVGTKKPGNIPCRIPSIMMTVTVKGNVLTCFEDFSQDHMVDNISNKNIIDIWNSEAFNLFRKNLLLGKRDLYKMCSQCNRIDEDLKEQLGINTMKKEKHFLGQEEVEAAAKVILSGNLFRYQSTESQCIKFENEFSTKIGAKHSLLITSGTNALITALAASGIGPGDEVIIPAYTFLATAAAVVAVGAIPIVVNIDHQFGISLTEISKNINDKTKGIIPVHMDGLCCDIEGIIKIAEKRKLVVIEDACQALGAQLNGKFLGTFGDFGCFSLNKDKILTCGEGGIVVTNTQKNYEKVCTLSDSAFSFSPHHKDFFKEIIPTFGFSMRVSEISGAIMREQLKKLDMILAEYKLRKNIIKEILSKLEQIKIISGHDQEGECHIAIHLSVKDAEFASHLGKELRKKKIMAAPVSMRPGHVVWKWGKMLGELSHINDRQNPYLNNKKKYIYPKFNYLSTMDIIMSTLKIDIDLNWSLEETRNIAQRIKKSILTFDK